MSFNTPEQNDNLGSDSNNSDAVKSVNSSDTEAPIKSPCISVCALDGESMCTGCFRTGEEIREWGNASNDERRAILSLCHEREKKVNPFL